MVTPENVMSVVGRQVLQDMVELQMYLVAQAQQRPWPMMPRSSKAPPIIRGPFHNPVESSAACELLKFGFIERSSSQIFVVSKSGFQYYELEMKPYFTLG